MSKIEDLKEGMVIGALKNSKVVGCFTDSSMLPDWEALAVSKVKGDRTQYVLCNTVGNKYEPIVANTKKVGKPRTYIIRGQDIFNGVLNEHTRNLVMNTIKQEYLLYVKDIPRIDEFPCKIECEIHDTIKNPFDKTKNGTGVRWDVDNLAYPYLKAFPDLLTSLGKLKDDDRLFMPRSPSAVFIPIEKYEDRKLVFIISKETDERILNHNVYKELQAWEDIPEVLMKVTKVNCSQIIERFENILTNEQKQKIKDYGKDNIIF